MYLSCRPKPFYTIIRYYHENFQKFIQVLGYIDDQLHITASNPKQQIVIDVADLRTTQEHYFKPCLSGLHPRAPDLVTILSVPQLTGCSPGFRRCILDVAMNRCTARHTSEPPPAR